MTPMLNDATPEIVETFRSELPEGVVREVDVPVSIDSYKAEVARAALEAGAQLVNDVHGFRRDSEIASVAAEFGVQIDTRIKVSGESFLTPPGPLSDLVARAVEAETGRGKCPIVALTANALQTHREKCLQAGMDDFLAKPMKKAALDDVFLRWLDGPEEINDQRTA